MSKVVSTVLVAGAVAVSSAHSAQTAPEAPPTHIIVPANEIVWGPPPPTVPAGAQSATLYGNPASDGLFAMRLKAPKGYTLPPHTHPAPEIVTVISGVVRLGLGTRLDAANTRALPAGSFYSTEAGTSHYLIIEEDAVLQVNSRGPWGMHYLNPSDDPRNRTR